MKEELHTRSVWHRFTASFMAMLMLLSILTTMPVMALNITSITFKNNTSAEIIVADTFDFTEETAEGNELTVGGKTFDTSWEDDAVKLTPRDGTANVLRVSLDIWSSQQNVGYKVTAQEVEYSIEKPIDFQLVDDSYTSTIVFTLSNFSGASEITIEFNTINPKYNVSVTSSDDDLEVSNGLYLGSQVIEETKSLSFTVSSDPGKVVTAKKSVTGKKDETLIAEATESGEKWTYEFTVAVDSNMQISLSSKPKTYTVTVEGLNGEGFTTSLGKPKNYSVTKNYNDEFSFTLTPDDGYEPPVVKSTNGNTINKSGNVYTIPHVTQDTTITIEAKGKKKYSVSYVTKGEGFTATAEADDSVAADGTIDVEYDKDLTYTVTVDAAYSQSTPAVTANGKTFKGENQGGENVYTFKVKITGETNITVSGLKLNEYKVTYTKSESANFTTDLPESQTVSHGGKITFTVTPKEGYNNPIVKIDDTNAKRTSSGNSYTISNITKDSKITIEDGEKKTFTVTKPEKPTGYSVDVDNVNPAFGDEITVTVTLDEAYSKSHITVYADSTPLTVDSTDGNKYTYKYTVKSDVNISVTGVNAKNTYQVELPGNGTGYTVTANNGNTVTHGGSLSFTVTVEEGYKLADSAKIVTVSGTDEDQNVLIENSGNTYTVTINNITSDDITVSVNSAKITAITYNITYYAGSDSSGHYVISGDTQSVNYRNSGFTFTVSPHTGYKIVSVTYSTNSGVVNADIPQQSGSTPAKANYAVSTVTSDVTVTITVEPIKVNVTYEWDDIDIGGGASIPGGSNTVTYKNEGTHSWNVNGEKVKIKLPDETKYKGFTCTWSGECDSDCITIDAEDSHTDLDITVTGTFTVKAPETPKHEDEGSNEDAQGGIPFVDASVNTNAEGGYDVVGERIYYRWSSTLSLLADGDIKDALLKEDYNIEACGFLLSASGSLSYDIETLKTLSANGFIGDGRNTYAYYNQTIGKLDLTTYNTYNQSIYFEINDYDGVVTRTGAFWYRLTIGGKTYVYVTNSITITCDFSAEKEKLQDEDPEDDEELSPESEDEEVMNDAGEEEVPSAEA